MSRPRTVLALIDLVQDLDVLLPVLERIQAEPELRLRVAVSRWLARRAPRIPQALKGRGLAFGYVARSNLLRGWAPRLNDVEAVLTASESAASPHRWAHALATRARAAGVSTFTLQHGVDHLEALCRLKGPGPRIASDVLFCWPPKEELPSGLDAETRAKAVCVGRPMPAAPSPNPPLFDLAVFENLHARGYADSQRQLVLDNLLGLARARPALRLCVRTHPAGGWLDRDAPAFAAFPNLTFVPSTESRQAAEPGSSASALAARVITTPSTVALDAAMAGRPVALALDGGALFSPLPVLETLADWIAFADAPPQASAGQADFLTRNLRPGDAAARIIGYLAASEGGARNRRPLVSTSEGERRGP